MIKIDYGDKEALLFSLYDKFEALSSSIRNFDMFSFSFMGKQYEITNEQKEIADQIIAIEKEAVANALDYYSTRLDELAEDIKGDIELRIILGQHTLTDFAELTPFLDLLAEKSPELHKQIIHFTVETFRNKDNLINTPYAQLVMKKLQEHTAEPDTRPVIKTTTHKSDIVFLERSKAGRKLQDKNELNFDRLFSKDGIIFPTYEYKTKTGIKTVETILSLSYEQVKEWENYIPAFERLKPFDIEILAHAATLYIAGNRIISTDMLFRQMNGGKNKQPTEAMRREIYDSFCRLGRTWLYIDASQEVKAGLNKKAEFRGALLPCSMIIGDTILNGQPAHDCIKIYDTSPLIEYARLKGQVSPIALDMFNIPNVNRTEENIMLIGYLTRAFADMRNEKSDRNGHIISYEPLYEYLGVDGSNETQLRKNKAKIRKTVRTVLDSWVESLHIKGYQELTANNNPVKAGAKAAKIRIEFYTAKEKKIKD